MSFFLLIARVEADQNGLPIIPWGPTPEFVETLETWYDLSDAEAEKFFDALDADSNWPCYPGSFLVEGIALEEDSVSPNSLKPFDSPSEVPSVFQRAESEVLVAFSVGHWVEEAAARGSGGDDPSRREGDEAESASL